MIAPGLDLVWTLLKNLIGTKCCILSNADTGFDGVSSEAGDTSFVQDAEEEQDKTTLNLNYLKMKGMPVMKYYSFRCFNKPSVELNLKLKRTMLWYQFTHLTSPKFN